MAGQYDLGYKLLFAHPELVRELLADFTPFASLGAAELPCFERVNPSYVSDVLSERVDDIVWRVRLGEQWIYVYILIEFQATVDRWMALRMQVYVGLLYQDLIKRHGVDACARLPPVLPLVFYNGERKWSAPCELGELMTAPPAGLLPYQPSLKYFLIDQQRLDPAQLERHSGVLSLLFNLELSDRPEVLKKLILSLATWLNDETQESLRRDVTLWVRALIQREANTKLAFDAESLQEVEKMGARKFPTWMDAFEDRARGPTRDLLKVVLKLRFGQLTSELESKLEEASFDALALWSTRAENASTLDEVFAPGEAPAPTTPGPMPA